MVYSKKQLDKFGINKGYLESITRSPISSFTISSTNVGYGVHSDTYVIDISFKDGASLEMFAKDTYKDRSISTKLIKSSSLNQGEADILEFGNNHNCFMPKFYGAETFSDNGVEHTLVFLERWGNGTTLEDKFCDINEKYVSTEDPSEKEKIENVVVDTLLRTIDIGIWNDYQLTKYFNPKDSNGGLKIHAYTEGDISNKLLESVLGLIEVKALEQIIPNLRTNGSGKGKYAVEESDIVNIIGSLLKGPFEFALASYKDIKDVIKRFIAQPLAADPATHNIHHLDPIPNHILIDTEADVNPYNPNALVDLAEGKLDDDENPYLQFAVIDYQNVGFAPDHLPIARLVNYPSVFRLLPFDRIRQLKEHAHTQQKRLEMRHRDINYYNDISGVERAVYNEGFVQSSWFALLHNIGAMSFLSTKHRDKAEELALRNSLYKASYFINLNIERSQTLESALRVSSPNEKYSLLVELLKKLKLKAA